MSDHKTVFISYRRSASRHLARLIFNDLRTNGYDVFLDVNTMDNGAFDTIILNQIAARAHFVLVLSKGSLERCANDGDWLTREMREAIRLQRNIVPILEEGFDFRDEQGYLPPDLRDAIPRQNGPKLYHDYFDAAMNSLRDRFLKQPFSGQVAPTPIGDVSAVAARVQQAAQTDPPLTTKEAYLNRGRKRYNAGDYDGAIRNYDEAIRLDRTDSRVYSNRGAARYAKGDLDGAIRDYDETIRLDPKYSSAYNNRGFTLYIKGDLDGAIRDYDEALRLDPKSSLAYYSRGIVRQAKGDFVGAIDDYLRYLAFGGGEQYKDRAETEQIIRDLQKKL